MQIPLRRRNEKERPPFTGRASGNRSNRNTLGAAFRHLFIIPVPDAINKPFFKGREDLKHMDREQARQEVRRNWRTLIKGMTGEAKQRVNGETSYICPVCGHGTHGDGLTVNRQSKDGNSLKCFGGGCRFGSGDIIDLYQETTGADYNTALSLLAEQLGITIDPYRPNDNSNLNTPKSPLEAPQTKEKDTDGNLYHNEEKTPKNGKYEATEASTADYTEYYKACRERINDPAAVEYLRKRGISTATAAAYWLGYDPEADPATAPGATGNEYKAHPAARIICPTTKAHYIARAINPKEKYTKMNPKREKGAGAAGIFNERALYTQDVKEIFITEGFFNALSIIEAGATAIATNSASNADILLKALEEKPTKATLILAFDGDEAGMRATEKLLAGLQRLNVSHIIAGADIRGSGKEDANDLLTKDRGAFIEAVQRTQQKTAARPDNISFYIDNLMTGEIERFKREIKTGFDNLDRIAGGLYSGLYVIAAISSLGKTTFSAQMADQIAATGQDVLFFSMEQSRLEMVSKSIARQTYRNDPETAVTSLQIRRGYLPPQALTAAAQYKQEVKEHISIIEGNFNCNISFIGDYIRQYIRRNPETKPVVFIDYLQVLQPQQIGAGQQTTKQTIDSSITELKRISRELDITVFVISSVNRANYLTPIDFEALKESGSIEYTADVIFGLQLQCLNDPVFSEEKKIKEKREKVKAAKAANPRKIELSCLKNRYGVSTFSAYFNYYPANDYFEPCNDFDFMAAGQRAGHRL